MEGRGTGEGRVSGPSSQTEQALSRIEKEECLCGPAGDYHQRMLRSRRPGQAGISESSGSESDEAEE
jgi:hypothetical protein